MSKFSNSQRLSASRVSMANQQMNINSAVALSSRFNSESPAHVFLSFHNETRSSFTSHLHHALTLSNVETFIDNELQIRDELSPSLMKAIEESHVSIIIFSENYAFSKWCLEELIKILECNENQGHFVIPLFYKVEPSHVMWQNGSYKQAFEKHEQNNKDKVQQWRAALTKAANFSGWMWESETHRTEAEFIEEIVRDLLLRIHKIKLMAATGFLNLLELGFVDQHNEFANEIELRCTAVQSHDPNSMVSVDQDMADTSAKTYISPMETSSSEDELSSFETLRISDISQFEMNLPPKLDGLRIEECTYLEAIPKNLLHVMSTLKELYLIDCCSFKSFPPNGFLISLRTLYVNNCPKLEFFSSSESKQMFQSLAHMSIGSSCDSLTVFTLDFFPKLKYLSLWNCLNLVSFTISEEFMGDLTSFKSLEIRDCPNLKSFPIGGLPTPNMTSVFLSNCKILKNIPNSKKSFLSLQSLILSECPALESLSLEASSDLISLSISFCDKLLPLKSWGLYSFQYLSSFEIEGGCDGMESFPEEELLPNNLNSLRISTLHSLKKLDYNGFKHLNALQELQINGCNQLHSLPEQRLPFSLQYLCINQSPLLTQKLSTKAGEDWNKIAHIPLIEIDGKEIS